MADIRSERDKRIPREEIKRSFRQAGMAAAEADEVVDLAIHAAISATDGIFATAERSSTPAIKMNVLTVAVSILENELAWLKAAHAFAAKQTGITMTEVQVGGQAHG